MNTTVIASNPVTATPFRLGGFELESSPWVARVEHFVVPAVAAFLSLAALGLVL